MISDEDINNWFSYHTPTGPQIIAYQSIRYAARELAKVIFNSTPSSAAQTAAIRKLRECVMTANAAIACCTGG